MHITPKQYGRLLKYGYTREQIRALDRQSAIILIDATEKNGGKPLAWGKNSV